MKVGEMFMSLALIPDLKSWKLGQAVIDTMSSRLKQLAVDAVLATTDVKKAMNAIGIEAPKVKSHWERIKSTGDGVSSTFMRMAAAAAAFFSVAKVSHMVKEVTDLGGMINTTAQKTGLAAEAFQQWGHNATLNGSSFDDVGSAAKTLSKNLANFATTGQGPVADGFRALGISMNDPAVKSRDLNKIFFLIANKLSTMPDGAKKTAAMMDILGKSGADLIPTFNAGVRDISKFNTELDAMGAVMSGESAAALDALGSKMDTAKIAVNALKNQAIIALIPVIDSLVQRFQDWVKENKELIRSTITEAVSALATALGILATAVAFAIRHWRLFLALIAGAAVIAAFMKLVRLVMFFQAALTRAALQAIVSWAMILGPILLIAAAIVALGILIYVFRDQIYAALRAVGRFFADLGRKIGGWFSDAFDAVLRTAENLWDMLKRGFKAAWEWIADLPVIKQLIGLVNSVRDLMRGTPDDRTPEQIDQDAAAASGGNEADALYGPLGVYTRARDAAGATGALGPSDTMGPARTTNTTGVSVTNSYSIQIDAKNADARAVGSIVDEKLREHDERSRRETAAALGVSAP